MSPPQGASQALAFVRSQAAARRVLYTEKAKADLDAFDQPLDVDDIRDHLCAARDEEIDDFLDDETRAEKKVLILRLFVAETRCYCKVSLSVGWDRSVCVLSFKPWRAS